MRVEVHARPGSAATRVGGEYDGRLVVRVRDRAVDGRATVAVCRAVADALGIPARDVTVVSGDTSRRKVLDVRGDAATIGARLEELRRAADEDPPPVPSGR